MNRIAGYAAFACMFLAVAAIPTARATLVDHGPFTTDTATGLDWLDLPLTLGQSRDSVLAGAYVAHGWRYASDNEVSALFLGVGADPAALTSYYSSRNYLPAKTLAELLGVTYGASNAQGRSYGGIGITDTATTVGTFRTALFQYDEVFEGTAVVGVGGYMWVPWGDQWPHTGLPGHASFLVRSTVPEPSSVPMIGLALAAWALASRNGRGTARSEGRS